MQLFHEITIMNPRTDLYKGYIDLSKRRVSPEDITKCEERYMKSKTVASILRHVASKLPSLEAAEGTSEPAAEKKEEEKESKRSRRARQAAGEDVDIGGLPEETIAPGGSNEEERLEKLYDTIGWPLGKIYGHPYDAFKLALTWGGSTISYMRSSDHSLPPENSKQFSRQSKTYRLSQ